jgi:hypothetical protein
LFVVLSTLPQLAAALALRWMTGTPAPSSPAVQITAASFRAMPTHASLCPALSPLVRNCHAVELPQSSV